MFSETEHIDRETELLFRLSATPTAQEAAFALLLDSAPGAFTEAEVRAALDVPKTTAHVALRTLVREGAIMEERIGRTGRYSVDPSDPLVKALKIARAIRRAQLAIEWVRDRVDLAVLFGSASRGEDRRDSDIDMLVVAEDAAGVESDLSRHPWLQPVVMTPAKHMVLIAGGGTFAKETARGITIWERS